LTADSLTLTKFAGLLRSGVNLDQASSNIGDLSNSSVELRYLLAVARDAGSGVADAIDAVASLSRTRERFGKRIEVAQANPKSTARLVIWLPLLTLAMAQLVGWDVLGTLTERPIVLVSFSLGLCLLLTSKLITTRMIKKAEPEPSAAGAFLIGVALEASAGAHLLQAQEQAVRIYREHFAKSPPTNELAELKEVELLVQATGARASDLLLRQAQSMQEVELLESEIKIEKLGVRLMLPLGLGVLPAFCLLAIVPLMVTMLGSK
jgi:tight adherence protein B